MEFVDILREDPVLAWLVFLGLLVTVLPAGLWLWGKISGRTADEAEISPMRATKPTRFGNQTELVILFLGLLLLLAAIGWIRSTFFG